MTSEAAAALEAVVGRVDFLANRGALIMRGAAIFTWTGAVAATIAVFSVVGWPGWLVGIVCLIPGWLLWRYGDKLAGALDADQIRGQLGQAADLAKTRIVEVVDGVRATRRQPIRAGFRILKTVRGLRDDLDSVGIELGSIALISSPGSLAITAMSLAGGVGLWLAAVVGALLRVVF